MEKMTIKETAQWLLEHDGYLILTHKKPDGDAIGSAAALAAGLRQAGKRAYICYNRDIGRKLEKYANEFWAPDDFVPETVVSVDLASLELLLDNMKPYGENIALAIDHHMSNSKYCENLCLHAEMASCGEIIYEILLAMGVKIDKSIANALYVAVSTDTGCFAYNNTKEGTLLTASKLVSAGAENGKINKEMFLTFSKSRLVLESLIVSNMEFYEDGKVAVGVITEEIMKKAGATDDDTDSIASLPSKIDGVRAGILMRQQAEGGYKISLRTQSGINASEICGKFGGGGHPAAAGCFIAKEFSKARGDIVEATVRAVAAAEGAGKP